MITWENLIFTSILLIVFGIAVILIILYQGKNLNSEWTGEQEKAITQLKELTEKDVGNEIFKITINNLYELKEYYTISKVQANKAFLNAQRYSSIGVLILLVSICYMMYFKSSEIGIISIIASVIDESIAALFFWLYTQSIKQLNLYHNNLRELEKYLLMVNIIEKTVEEDKGKLIEQVINRMLGDKEEK